MDNVKSLQCEYLFHLIYLNIKLDQLVLESCNFAHKSNPWFWHGKKFDENLFQTSKIATVGKLKSK